MKIIGIDPGSTRIGYGLIEAAGTNMKLITHGTLEIKTLSTSDRLHELGTRLTLLIDEHKPEYAGVETLYFSKNKKTALSVSQARGVILLALRTRNIPIYECAPVTVKQAVTGYGKSDKRAVLKMITAILGTDAAKSTYDDASDALAIAIATAFHASPRNIHNRIS